MDGQLDLRIDPASVASPAEQVASGIAALVASADLRPASRLPTVRALAEQLHLAPNTVAKAYRQLEADGVIETHGRAGTFVRGAALDSMPATVRAAAENYLQVAADAGLDADAAVRAVATVAAQ